MPDFLTIDAAKPANIEIEIQRSRFLAYAARSDDEDAARHIIYSQKQHYPDARHHCSAYTYLPPGLNPVHRSSDDGEPSGTAGRPMLDVLVGSGLQNTVVVVTRYFGGIKLGTGGLVRAYSRAVHEVIDAACLVRVTTLPVVSFEVPLAQAPGLEAWLRGHQLVPLEIDWGTTATFRLALAGITATELSALLSEQLGTATTLTNTGTQIIELPA